MHTRTGAQQMKQYAHKIKQSAVQASERKGPREVTAHTELGQQQMHRKNCLKTECYKILVVKCQICAQNVNKKCAACKLVEIRLTSVSADRY